MKYLLKKSPKDLGDKKTIYIFVFILNESVSCTDKREKTKTDKNISPGRQINQDEFENGQGFERIDKELYSHDA
jgi:hypothetical protein